MMRSVAVRLLSAAYPNFVTKSETKEGSFLCSNSKIALAMDGEQEKADFSYRVSSRFGISFATSFFQPILMSLHRSELNKEIFLRPSKTASTLKRTGRVI